MTAAVLSGAVIRREPLEGPEAHPVNIPHTSIHYHARMSRSKGLKNIPRDTTNVVCREVDLSISGS